MIFALTPVAAGVARYGFADTGALASDFELAMALKPASLALHIASAATFMAVGALQLGPGLRQRHPALHRRLGYVGWSAGLLMGLTGVWLQVAHPWAEGAEWAAQAVRAVMAALLLYWLAAGLRAILNRNVAVHRAHMLRAYVVGAGATTNGVLIGVWVGAGQDLSPNAFAIIMAVGWAGLLLWLETRVIHRGQSSLSSSPGKLKKLSASR